MKVRKSLVTLCFCNIQLLPYDCCFWLTLCLSLSFQELAASGELTSTLPTNDDLNKR